MRLSWPWRLLVVCLNSVLFPNFPPILYNDPNLFPPPLIPSFHLPTQSTQRKQENINSPSKMASVNLAPVPQPIAIFDKFTAHQTETLAIKEKVMSLTGDSFDVKLANGQPIFKVKGKLMSISGRKSITDTSDNHLFDLVKEHLHLHTTFVAESPDKKKLLEVKSGFSRAFLSLSPFFGTI